MIRKFFVWLTVALALGLSFYFYKDLPSEIPSKFANLKGSPTDYASKDLILFVIPFSMIISSLALSVITIWGKQSEVFKRLGKILDSISLALNIVLLILHCAIIYIGLGNQLNILLLLPIIVGIVFIITGNLLPRLQLKEGTKENSLKQATYDLWHQVSRTVSYALFFGGFVMIFSILLPKNLILSSFFIILVLTILSAFFFSYIRYTRYANTN
ncbi:DUF1648 domain-containing protein [Cytobacillus dafuensis]|uniref:DUF1648 domain-containing protein n=1 Tax=Cytobacillus dafuensis TaxID=1742359 RepID=A0A5B8Z6J5_CYTDA|nr:DUF1648 domain-containing protein [Cytobacillus dafuensis]QED47016.1 DUF1648 domain-containing protein [Cytobacillus dafuensis]